MYYVACEEGVGCEELCVARPAIAAVRDQSVLIVAPVCVHVGSTGRARLSYREECPPYWHACGRGRDRNRERAVHARRLILHLTLSPSIGIATRDLPQPQDHNLLSY